jgi:hypothetical protein
MIDHMTHGPAPSYQPPQKPQTPSPLDLLDLRFERRFGPILVKWLYLSILVLIGTLTLFGMLMSWSLSNRAGWEFLLGIPISLATGTVWALGLRLVCEQLIRWTGPDPVARHASNTSGQRLHSVDEGKRL